MSDLAGLLYTAKDKIMILRSVKFLPEAASFTYNRLSGNKKMTDIVIGAQKIQIKIGLQMRLKMLAQVCSQSTTTFFVISIFPFTKKPSGRVEKMLFT